MKDLQKLVAQYKKQVKKAKNSLKSNAWHGYVFDIGFQHKDMQIIEHYDYCLEVAISNELSPVELFKFLTETTHGSRFELWFDGKLVNQSSFKFEANLHTQDVLINFRGSFEDLDDHSFTKISDVRVLIGDI